MKRSADKWHTRLSDHVAFFGYRWLTWVIAGLSLTIPGRVPEDLPRNAGLLLLLLVITVVITTLAPGYTRLARQRPAILLLDLVASAAIVWMSGGTALPFLPYAFGSLVLPALLFGWRGALMAGLFFVALDQASLILLAPQIQGAAFLSTMIARALTPLAFGFMLVAIGRFLVRHPASTSPVAASPTGLLSDETRPGGMSTTANPRLGMPNTLGRELGTPAPSAGLPASTIVRAAGTTPAPQAVYDYNHNLEIDLPAAIDQLVAGFSRQTSLALRTAVVGAQRLTLAQHTVLLRTAQEALQNVVQHAHAHTALITLTFESRAVTLVVQDDGVGLLDGTYERPGLHAMRALRYRLTELDGQLAVFESESGGVTVRATLPLDPV